MPTVCFFIHRCGKILGRYNQLAYDITSWYTKHYNRQPQNSYL